MNRKNFELKIPTVNLRQYRPTANCTNVEKIAIWWIVLSRFPATGPGVHTFFQSNQPPILIMVKTLVIKRTDITALNIKEIVFNSSLYSIGHVVLYAPALILCYMQMLLVVSEC